MLFWQLESSDENHSNIDVPAHHNNESSDATIAAHEVDVSHEDGRGSSRDSATAGKNMVRKASAFSVKFDDGMETCVYMYKTQL